MSRRSVGVAPVVAAAVAAGVALLACRQILGVEDLGVVSDAGRAGDAGADASPGSACNAEPTTEGCYNCCSQLDGGDLSFFSGELHACTCNTQCSADCSNYCGPTAPGDTNDCDLCVYLSAFRPLSPCRDAGIAASQTSPGAAAIYDCIDTCSPPSDSECAGLSTLRGCYDCCEGKHRPAMDTLFGAAGRACVCDAGCAGACPDYCPNDGTDVGACTRCALGSLVDGGCAPVGAASCKNQDCTAMVACMQLCAQPQ